MPSVRHLVYIVCCIRLTDCSATQIRKDWISLKTHFVVYPTIIRDSLEARCLQLYVSCVYVIVLICDQMSIGTFALLLLL